MEPRRRAAELLKSLDVAAGGEVGRWGEDLLVFLYELRDNHSVVKSSSKVFSGKSFAALGELMYELEARPDETASSDDRKIFIRKLLEDIAAGRIVTSRKV